MIEYCYGFFPGGDPRDFHPDQQCCTEAELALHKEHCASWDAGYRPSVKTCEWINQEDGTMIHVSRSAYGLGSYTIEIDDDEWESDAQ